MNIISEINMTYFCNGCGEAFYWDANGSQMAQYGDNWNLIDEHIPELLRAAYNTAWGEGYGYPCYIMEIHSKPYLALIAEFGDTVFKNSKAEYFRGEDLKAAILKAAADLEKKLTANEESGVEIFFPEDTNTPFCQWELVVAVPADGVTMERMTRVAAIMDVSFEDVNYILASSIVWDTDDEVWDTDDADGDAQAEDLELPEFVNVPVSELLEDGEKEDDLDREELLDRITDWLSDTYGFCVYSFDAE